jgi:hypothetical protein
VAGCGGDGDTLRERAQRIEARLKEKREPFELQADCLAA